MKGDIVFLPGYNQNLPKRHRELIKSAALSHAGAAAHRRRRRERKGDTATADTTTPSERQPSSVSLAELNQRATIRTFYGNSDPFDVAGVLHLSPRVAEILKFVRSHYLPAPFAVPPHSRAMLTPFVEDHVREGFKGILASLQEPSCAQAYLYSAAVGMSLLVTADSSLVTERLRMKGQALSALRDQFREGIRDQTILLRSTEYLFSAAIMDRDTTEAKTHGAMVRDLLYAKALREGYPSINSSFLIRTMFKDAMLSEYSNTPTVFDIQIWEPVLVASLAPTEDMLPDLVPAFDEPLDDFLADKELIAIFSDARRALWAYRRPWLVFSGYAGQYWAHSRLVVVQCRAVNRYVEVRRYVSSSPVACSGSLDSSAGVDGDQSQRVEACLTLAVLLFASLFRCRLEQLFYHNTSQLLSQLRSTLEKTLDGLSVASKSSNEDISALKVTTPSTHNAILWSLFIGAVVEIQTAGNPDIATTITSQFHQHIRRMGLSSWSAVEQILNTFVYSSQLLHPSEEERARLLGPFSEFDPDMASTPLDERLEQPWLCHEANFTAYLNRTESLRGSVLRSSTDRR